MTRSERAAADGEARPAEVAGLAAAAHEAEARVRPWVRETFVELSLPLSRLGGAEVWLKLENLQHTGSFKVRGAVNRLLTLDEEARARGVVAASTGNHGAAVAYGASRLEVPGVVFVPEEAAPEKVRAIESRGLEVRRVAGDPLEAEKEARRHADARGMTYVSPYNDLQVVAGQGTVGVELGRQCPPLDAVFVSLGGGGLISGVGAVLRQEWPRARIVGCSPANSAVMIESIRAGRILEMPSAPTLSDGTAGGVEAGAVTFDLCRALVDDLVTVAEEKIRTALVDFLGAHPLLIEGAAAVAVAAYLGTRQRWTGGRVGIVLCGGNIGLETLRSVLGQGERRARSR